MSSLAAIDISDAATRVEVILREPKPGGLPLAMVVRNLDGERGRRLLASARIPPNEVDHEGNAPKMAGYNRTSALTQGAGQTNDVLSTLVHNEGLPSQFEIDEGVPRLVREVVRSQHDTSRIFNNRGKQDELEHRSSRARGRRSRPEVVWLVQCVAKLIVWLGGHGPPSL